jgi:hypothetical protein
MANTRDEIFIQQQPRITTADLKNAAKANRVVASWNSHPAVDKNRQIMARPRRLIVHSAEG